MNRRRLSSIALLLTVLLSFGSRHIQAQDAVPVELLYRTMLLRTVTEQGTGFAIGYKGKLYIVTARHVVTGVPATGAKLQIRRDGQWLDLFPTAILFPAKQSIDIAVLATGWDDPGNYKIECGDSPTMGQQVWFLGYPFLDALSSHFKAPGDSKTPHLTEAPFIKRATMSAIDSSDADATVFYFDGFNNRGFSGGPIVYWDFGQRVYKILAIVQGYRNDTASANVNGTQVDTNILVNSGILVGYSIQDALKAIDAAQPAAK